MQRLLPHLSIVCTSISIVLHSCSSCCREKYYYCCSHADPFLGLPHICIHPESGRRLTQKKTGRRMKARGRRRKRRQDKHNLPFFLPGLPHYYYTYACGPKNAVHVTIGSICRLYKRGPRWRRRLSGRVHDACIMHRRQKQNFSRST